MNELNARYLELQQLIIHKKHRGSKRSGRLRRWLDVEEEELLLKEPDQTDKTKSENGKELTEYEKELAEIIAEADRVNYEIPLEKISRENGRNEEENELLLVLFFAQLQRGSVSGKELLAMVSSNTAEMLKKLRCLLPKGGLRKSGLVHTFEGRFFHTSLLETEYRIDNRTFYKICGLDVDDTEPLYREDNIRDERKIIWFKEPEVTMENLFLADDIKDDIECALWKYQHGPQVLKECRIIEKTSYGLGTIMLFYGPPGTGKTATAEAIAHKLGKKVGFVQYSQLYNCYVGESEKTSREYSKK